MLKYYTSRDHHRQQGTGSPPANQWGYALGGDGRIATLVYFAERAKKEFPGTWKDYLARVKKWIGRPVLDCYTVAEAFYKKIIVVSIDIKARYNYSNWCSRKSPLEADDKLPGSPQLPGVAVFIKGCQNCLQQRKSTTKAKKTSNPRRFGTFCVGLGERI